MKYSIIIFIVLTTSIFSRIVPIKKEENSPYSLILENFRLNKGLRFGISENRDYKSEFSSYNAIPKKVQEWIKNLNGKKINFVHDIDLIYNPSDGGKVKAEIYSLSNLARKFILNYAFAETSLPPVQILKKVCQTILNMEKCKNEFVTPFINKETLKTEIVKKMNSLLFKNYRILDLLPRY